MSRRFIASVLAVWLGVGVHLPQVAWGTEGQTDVPPQPPSGCDHLCTSEEVCNRFGMNGDLMQAGVDIWRGGNAAEQNMPSAIRVAERNGQCQINGGTAFRKPADMTCDAVAGQALICQGNVGQRHSYCATYRITKDDGYWASQVTLLALDVAIAASCFTAYGLLQGQYTKAAGEVLAQVCSYGGTVEGLLQMAFSQANIQTGNQEWFGHVTTAMGITGGVISLGRMTMTIAGTQMSSADRGQMEQTSNEVITITNGVLYSGMAIARGIAMGMTVDTGNGACTQLRGLASDQPRVSMAGWSHGDVVGGNGGGGADLPPPPSAPRPRSPSGGGSAGGLAETLAGCVDQGSSFSSCMGQQSLATAGMGYDSDIHSKGKYNRPSGAPSLRDYMAHLQRNGIASAISKGAESMGLPADQAARLKGGLTAMARDMSKDPEKALRLLGGGAQNGQVQKAVLASKSAASAKGKNAFALDWGAKTPANAGPAVGAVMEFAKPEAKLDPAEGDIWHETFKGSIFEIVSYRLDKSRERITQMEWQTPLNRALTGLRNSRPVVERTPASNTGKKR